MSKEQEEKNSEETIEQLKDNAIKEAEEAKKEIDYDTINNESFRGVKYQDLLAKFKELGVESAWTPGKPQAEMINNALQKIAVLRELKKKGIDGDKADETADKLLEVKKIVDNAETEIKEVKKKESVKESRAAEKKRILAMDLTKPQLQSALDNVNANIKGGVPQHRDILLRKQSILMEILDVKEDKE